MAKSTLEDQFRQYTEVSWNGRQLLKEHSLDKVGIWRIKGEDPNPDLHGSHYQPELGIFEGKLRDVIMYGISLPNFWQWGAGGNFIFIGESVPKIDNKIIELKRNLEKELEETESKLKEIKKKLGKL